MGFDFGVGLAFWLTILSTLACIGYGLYHWNRGAEEHNDNLEQWVDSEQKINETL